MKKRPCDTCPIFSTCGSSYICSDWRTWFLAAWKEFNAYALSQGLEIEELKQDGNES